MVSHGSLSFPATVPSVPTCTNNTSSTIHTGNCTTTQNPPLAVTPIPSFLPLNSSGSFFPFPTPSTDFQLFLSRPFDLSISRRRLPSPSHTPHLDLDLSSLTIFDRCPFYPQLLRFFTRYHSFFNSPTDPGSYLKRNTDFSSGVHR